MLIPNDTGHPWRMNKFCDYVVDSTDGADTNLLKEYANIKKMDLDDRIWLAYLHSCTNAEVTAITIYNKIDYRTVTEEELETFWTENRPKLMFLTDRLYVKSNNWFCTLINTFLQKTDRKPHKLLDYAGDGDAEDKYKKLYKEILGWKFHGRFSADLFLGVLITVTGLDIKLPQDEFNWAHARTMTSGMLHIMYRDEEAQEFDDARKFPEGFNTKELDDMLEAVIKKIQERKPEYGMAEITPKLCAWRKFFKEACYGAYYLDRQLGNLAKNQLEYPELAKEFDLVLKARELAFPVNARNELKGVKGVQKAKCKDWVAKGITGLEEDQDEKTN